MMMMMMTASIVGWRCRRVFCSAILSLMLRLFFCVGEKYRAPFLAASVSPILTWDFWWDRFPISQRLIGERNPMSNCLCQWRRQRHEKEPMKRNTDCAETLSLVQPAAAAKLNRVSVLSVPFGVSKSLTAYSWASELDSSFSIVDRRRSWFPDQQPTLLLQYKLLPAFNSLFVGIMLLLLLNFLIVHDHKQ